MAMPPHMGMIRRHCNGFSGEDNYLQLGGTRPQPCNQLTPLLFQGNTTILGTNLCLVRSISCAATISPHSEACKTPRAPDQHTHMVDFPMMADPLPRSTRMELHTR